jgi:hypothetical protein
MATLRCEIYEPPKKDMPFLAVRAIGTSFHFAYAAKTRKEAETLLADEIKIIEQRAELHAMYGQHRDED